MGKKKAAPVHAVVVLDRSGSMTPIADATVEGLGTYVADLKADGGEVYLSLLQFDHEHEWLIQGDLVADVEGLPPYRPRGNTALNDAIALAVAAGDEAEKLGRRPLLVIVTDGMENASVELPGHDGRESVRAMLEERQEGHGWVVTYLTADLSSAAWEQSAAYGVPVGATVGYAATADSTTSAFASVGSVTRAAVLGNVSSSKTALADSGLAVGAHGGLDLHDADADEADRIRRSR